MSSATSAFFVFNAERCRLVRGAVGAALYDLEGGAVIPLPPRMTRLLHQRYASLVITDGERSPDLLSFLSFLKNNHLGDYRSETPAMPEDIPLSPTAFRPDLAWCELTDACNLRCFHCYGSFGPDTASGRKLSMGEWRRVLGQLRDEGFSRVQFIGGEPLLHSGLRELLFEASKLGFSFIEVFSNLVLMDDRVLNACAATGASLATTVYSTDAAIHDSVTQVAGSFDRTIAGMKRSLKWGIPVRASCIVSRYNEGRIGNIEEFIEDMGAAFGGMDQARPSGRGADSSCVTTMPCNIMGPPFITTRSSFLEALYFNPCWHGKIAVSAEGSVMPCVFARDCVAGSIRTKSISEIMELDNRASYWRMTKDSIATCRDCEFRYACPDCRPQASGWSGKLDSMTRGCAYDPYKGRMRTNLEAETGE